MLIENRVFGMFILGVNGNGFMIPGNSANALSGIQTEL
jgi:hypothetical protein